MRRRDFIWICGGSVLSCAIGCDAASTPEPGPDPEDQPDAGSSNAPVDTNPGADACAQAVVKMHDTYAQALYLDGTYGPLTGVVEVAYVTAGSAITLDFWHGHGGQQHRFTLEPSHFDALKQGQRVTVGTTTVDGHEHTLFVDPLDEDYRVPGAPDVDVPLGHCQETP
jgi:hypothetical protein